MESGPLHFFKIKAGTPSGPEPELFDSSSIAFMISSAVKYISQRLLLLLCFGQHKPS